MEENHENIAQFILDEEIELEYLKDENQKLKARVAELEKMKPTCPLAVMDKPHYQCQSRNVVTQKENEIIKLKARVAELEEESKSLRIELLHFG